jgi:cap2 methyltransferase
MRAQKNWHLLLNSKRSILKFRLPWDDKTSTYLAGDIYLPVWGKPTTTEARLITSTNPSATATYDHKIYESQMFYFNTVTRHSLYPHSTTAEGIDHCYNCRAEIEILTNYFTHFLFPTPKPHTLPSLVSALSTTISRSLSKRRTLRDPAPSGAELCIKERQYINGVAPCRINAPAVTSNHTQ